MILKIQLVLVVGWITWAVPSYAVQLQLAEGDVSAESSRTLGNIEHMRELNGMVSTQSGDQKFRGVFVQAVSEGCLITSASLASIVMADSVICVVKKGSKPVVFEKGSGLFGKQKAKVWVTDSYRLEIDTD